jgi:DNA-binding beta-propeller fold protein YncE
MARHSIKYFFVALTGLLACQHKIPQPLVTGGDYPPDVANIILTKCATDGCHNNLSYSAAGDLNLTTWENLFKGSGTGSVVIPYRPDFSSMCYFTNTDSSAGLVMLPVMPVGRAPLSKAEYYTLKAWIENGAPDVNGKIKFADNPNRNKIYVTNRLCDVVTVFDEETMLQMRYVDVGNKPASEFPYCVKVAPDKKYWYVSFFANSDMVQRFDAENDKPSGELKLGMGAWTSFAITADSKHGYFVDNSNVGKIVYADLEHLNILNTIGFGNSFKYPIGIAINEQLKKLYVGSASGNFIYSINITDPTAPVVHQIIIDGTSAIKYETALDPGELLIDENSNKCYIACSGSNEIRVLNMLNDSLIGIIPLGASPAFISLSELTNRLFVSCPDDEISFPGNRGSVEIIDLLTNTVYKKINTGYQPYGIAADDRQKIVTVVNANISSAGPASHHASRCGQKNGNVTFIDLNTLELIPHKKREVAVFPFGAALR